MPLSMLMSSTSMMILGNIHQVYRWLYTVYRHFKLLISITSGRWWFIRQLKGPLCPLKFTTSVICNLTHTLFPDLQGGNIIRLFHKELEAYIVAEGLFEDEITEDGKLHYAISFNLKWYLTVCLNTSGILWQKLQSNIGCFN